MSDDEHTETTKNSQLQNRRTEADVWEEEIDLRELTVDVLNKWYIWVILPIIVMIGTGVYFYNQPDQYRISTSLILDVDPGTANSLNVETLTSEKLTEIIKDNIEATANVQNAKSEQILEYEVNLSTPNPDTVKSDLRQNRDQILTSWIADIKKEVADLEQIYRTKIEDLNDDIEIWTNLPAVDGPRGLAPFAEDFKDYRGKLRFIDKIMNEPKELIVWNLNQLEGELVGPKRIRNTFLSGVVTFLLALFGVTFWEIL